MKIYYFKIPERSVLPFIRLCEGLDITVMISWKEDGDLLSSDFIVGYIRIHDTVQIPAQMQLDKLNEKYGNNIKPA